MRSFPDSKPISRYGSAITVSYDYEAENHAEDREDRSRLNHLYDDYVARWGYFNQKANTDIIKMDATGVEMLFLERSENGRYHKAGQSFDHSQRHFPPRN